MKREAFDHPKLKLLARDLSISLSHARGIVVSLWVLTGISFPRGDIGRLTNEEIAVAIDYPGDPDELIAILNKRRLLDELSDCRLYVHDWHDHADALTHRRLVRANEVFANGYTPNLRRCTPDERRAHDERTGNARSAHAVAEPEPEPTKKTSSPSGDPAIDFDSFWAVYPRKVGKGAASRKWKSLKPDAELAQRITRSVVEHCARDPAWVEAALRGSWKFVPHPETYLSQQRWEDEPPKVPTAQERPFVC